MTEAMLRELLETAPHPRDRAAAVADLECAGMLERVPTLEQTSTGREPGFAMRVTARGLRVIDAAVRAAGKVLHA